MEKKACQDSPIPSMVEFNVQENVKKTSFGLQSKLSLIRLKQRHFFFPLITIERDREREQNNRSKLTAASL